VRGRKIPAPVSHTPADRQARSCDIAASNEHSEQIMIETYSKYEILHQVIVRCHNIMNRAGFAGGSNS